MPEKIEEFLSGLKPAGAPKSIDDAVYATVEKNAAVRRASRRMMFLAPALAAAVVIGLVVIFTIREEPPANTQPVQVAELKKVEAEPSAELLAGKAKILEIKIATMRRMAALETENGSDLSELDALEAEIKAIGEILEDGIPKPDESMKTSLYGGKSNA